MLPADDLAASNVSRNWGRVALIVLVLALSSVWLIGRWIPPLDQNRSKAGLPPVSGDLPFDLEAHQKIDSFVRDQLPVGRLTVPALAALGNRVGYSLRSDVWQGRAGQLFLSSDFTKPCRQTRVIEELSRTLRTAPAQGSDPQLRVVVPPDKSSALRDQVWASVHPGGREALTSCQMQREQQLDKLIEDHSRAITWVDGIPEAAARFDQPAFNLGDTHWSPAGASALALKLGVWVSPEHPFPAATQVRYFSVGKRMRTGNDLYRLAGLRRSDSDPYVASSLPGVHLEAVTTPGADPAVIVRLLAPGAPLGGRTLMYVDSFFNSAAPTLTPLFSDLTVLTNKRDVRPFLDASRGQFDHVIVLSVQRHTASMLNSVSGPLISSLKPQPDVSWQAPAWPN